ncbi:hypothetical protein [Streptomyces sp. NPDC048385]|uniref:hypothetical protein n=1 Tax=unclassified Streptomyces TaxID=2593676 RepID=UPI003422AF5F
MGDAPRRSDSAIRRAIRRQWEADGHPPCSICRTPIADDEISYASQIYKTVVHRLCCSAPIGASTVIAEQCSKIRETRDEDAGDFCEYPRFCRCPLAGAVNMIVFARRIGLPVIEVSTAASPGCEREARAAGLGITFENVPLREIAKYHPMFVRDEAEWDKPVNWYEPPTMLLVDVTESFRAGRITAYAGDDVEQVRAALDDLMGTHP